MKQPWLTGPDLQRLSHHTSEPVGSAHGVGLQGGDSDFAGKKAHNRDEGEKLEAAEGGTADP